MTSPPAPPHAKAPPGAPSTPPAAAVHRAPLSPRALLLGILGILVCVYWNVYGEVISQTDLTSTSLMMPPIIVLMALLCWNGTLGKVWHPLRLSNGELLGIYLMMTVGVVVTGMGWTQFLITSIGAAPHYATPSNGWDRFVQYAPSFLLPDHPARTLKDFYLGQHPVPWAAWTRPVLVYGVFIMVMLFAMMCMNVMVRKQWVEREKLSFPIVYLPMEMTANGASFWSNRMMWLGFLIPVFLESMNSLNYLYPSVPYLQIRAYSIGNNFVNPPWNAIGGLSTTYYPLAIGMGFLLSTDVSFSCWFFYVCTKMENVFCAALGLRGAGVSSSLSGIPYQGHQGAGAWIAIAALSCWMARHHLSDVFRKAFTGAPEIDDSDEFLSYRTAVFGLIGSVLAIVGFWHYCGMNLLPAVTYLGAYLLFALTISRMRAEAGPAWIMGPGFGARQIATTFSGSSMLDVRNETMMAHFRWFSSEMRCTPSPTQIEGFRLADGGGLRRRNTSWAMLLAMAVGTAAGIAFCLTVWYHFGAESAKVDSWRTSMGRTGFRESEAQLNNPPQFNPLALGWFAAGAAFTFFLSTMRVNFVWFPFHPVGYALANTGTLDWLWLPFFIAWLFKFLIIRYGGIRTYRHALPFFMGLVLGDYVISGLWSLAGSILGIHMYRCFPV